MEGGRRVSRRASGSGEAGVRGVRRVLVIARAVSCLLVGTIVLGAIGLPALAQLEDWTCASAILTVRVEQAVVLRILRVDSLRDTIDALGPNRGSVYVGDVVLSTEGICAYVVLISATMDSGRLPTRGFRAQVLECPPLGMQPWQAELGKLPVPLFSREADWPLATESTVGIFCDPSSARLETGTHTLQVTFAILERE